MESQWGISFILSSINSRSLGRELHTKLQAVDSLLR